MRPRDLISADYAANRTEQPHTRLVVLFYRLASIARGSGARPRLWAVPIIAIYKMVSTLFGIELPVSVTAGPGLRIQHGHGLVVHRNAVLGAGVVLKHGVTLGIRTADDRDGAPTIGDRVVFGPGSQALGRITVGDGAQIGAGAVVLADVPAGATAVGVPARVLER